MTPRSSRPLRAGRSPLAGRIRELSRVSAQNARAQQPFAVTSRFPLRAVSKPPARADPASGHVAQVLDAREGRAGEAGRVVGARAVAPAGELAAPLGVLRGVARGALLGAGGAP